MPLVFVHGVATRRSPSYDRVVRQRTAMWKSFLGPARGVPAPDFKVINPYWGEVAATFAWHHASLPAEDAEKFGGADVEHLLAEILGTGPGARSVPLEGVPPLTAVARNSLADAIDLLWAAAAERATAQEADKLAALASAAMEYAEKNPHPSWVHEVTDDRDFVARLLPLISIKEEGGEQESFGPSANRRAVGRLREGIGRIATAAPRAASTGLLAATRARTHRSVSLFLGDVLCYLRQREQHRADAPIARTVTAAIEEAHDSRTDADPQVVVVAHSMGGNIMYDLLSHLRTDLSADVLVTVGSQVGVFAELGLLPAVAAPTDHVTQRAPELPNLGRWLNVYDPDDVLAFVVGGIFAGAQDYRYSTGRGLLHAHSSYFVRPSFHRTLARRLGTSRAKK